MATPSAGTLLDSRAGTPAAKRTNYRWTLAIFVHLFAFMSYMDRINLSVATPAIIKELHFTLVEIGTIQTAFFVCYALCQIPSGMLTEYFGHRRVLAFAVIWWSVFTSVTALCGKFSSWIVVRSVFAIGESPVYPGSNTAISIWFPKKERGKAAGFLQSGGCVGRIVGIPLAVYILATWGWRAIFLVFGLVGIVLATAYYKLMRTHPRESRFVNQAELDYITEGREASTGTKRSIPPWKVFFRSSQFWAIIIPAAATNFINYIFVAWLPVYLLQAHHFSLKQMGAAAGLVFAAEASGGLTGGAIADHVLRTQRGSPRIRAWLGGMGLLVCCCGLCMTAISTGQWPTVMWLALSLCSMGFSFSAIWASCADMGGKFTGTLTGWTNFWGNLIGGGLGPILIAWISSQYNWQAAILVTASVGAVGAIGWIFVKPDIPLRTTLS
jgi:ACS family glucarate transporter-like MFS transporter